MRSLTIETTVTMAWDERDTLTPELIEITKEQVRIYQEAVAREAIKHQHQNPQWRQGALVGIQSGLLADAKMELESVGRVREPFSYNSTLDFTWDGEKVVRSLKVHRHGIKDRFEGRFVHSVDRQLGAVLFAELGQHQLIELLPNGWIKTGLPQMQKADVLQLSKSELSARIAAVAAPRIIERPGMTSAIHPMHWDPASKKVFYPLDITIPCLSDGTFPVSRSSPGRMRTNKSGKGSIRSCVRLSAGNEGEPTVVIWMSIGHSRKRLSA